MVYLTKRITMTETAWAALREIVDDAYNECVTLDISDAQTALAEADTLAETVSTVDETSEIDAWVMDATNEGRNV